MDSSVVPHERAVMDAVIALWRSSPSSENYSLKKLHEAVKDRNNDWSLSEKRMKSILKKFNLLPNPTPESLVYANEITSKESPAFNLPEKVKLVMTSKRGKGLFAKANIKKGETLWKEWPLFLVPPLAHLDLIKRGNACTFCGQLVRRLRTGISVLSGEDCKMCPEVWCSKVCKSKNQKLHGMTKHENARTALKVNPQAYSAVLDYAVKEQWNALYAITLITASIIADESGVQQQQFEALASVSQRVRSRIASSSGSATNSSFLKSQHEQLWEEGYDLYKNVFPSMSQEPTCTLESFLVKLGAYNINNLDSSIFLIQSHLNHNCEPNVEVITGEIRRDTAIEVVASRSISSGEEITTTYVNPLHSFAVRQNELRINWGFLCKCKRCKNELVNQHDNSPPSTVQETKSVHFES